MTSTETENFMNYDPTKSARVCGCDPGANNYHCSNYPNCVGGDLDKMELHEESWKRTCPDEFILPGIADSGKRVTYASGAQRDPSKGKIKWSRITFGPMMRRWAQHLTNAEVKYPDPTPGLPNFSLIEGPEELVRYKESAFRHFMDWFHGDISEDHAAAVFFNINGVEIIKAKAKANHKEVADPFSRQEGALISQGNQV